MTKNKISVLVIDSDPKSLTHTIKMLESNTSVCKIDSAEDSDKALFKMIEETPDMVLIEYPTKGNAGKELIKYIKTKLADTTIIFVSETKDYAADAIQNEIFNYLLKPVPGEELKKIINKALLIKQTNIRTRINDLIESTQEEGKIKIQTTRGYFVIHPDEIIYCKADGFCTEVVLTSGRVEVSYIFLSKLEEMLRLFNFLRINRSYVVNQKYIRKIYRGSYNVVLSHDGKEYEIKGSKTILKDLSNYETNI